MAKYLITSTRTICGFAPGTVVNDDDLQHGKATSDKAARVYFEPTKKRGSELRLMEWMQKTFPLILEEITQA